MMTEQKVKQRAIHLETKSCVKTGRKNLTIKEFLDYGEGHYGTAKKRFSYRIKKIDMTMWPDSGEFKGETKHVYKKVSKNLVIERTVGRFFAMSSGQLFVIIYALEVSFVRI